ncbi:cytidine deaminase [Aerococcaceae bacterium DSM 111020]|nr:cytidine deaminase [Aerococcaceae bacterium DSM 111020]
MSEQEYKKLVEAARHNLDKAYVPYSHFPVGAALLMKDNTIISGVNVENVSFGATNCAERTAIFSAIAQGYSKEDFKAMAVAGNTNEYLPPCSICRQVMVEFCDDQFPVYLTREDHEITMMTVGELVPMAFESMDI